MNTRRLCTLFVALVALAVPGIAAPAAFAGCQARGGAISDHAGYEAAYGYMDCTTNNGANYQMRAYMQGSSGGYHIVNPAIVFNICCPVNNSSYSRYFAVQCSYFSPSDTTIRTKIVVENTGTGSTDVAYGPAKTKPAACS